MYELAKKNYLKTGKIMAIMTKIYFVMVLFNVMNQAPNKTGIYMGVWVHLEAN